MFSFTEIINHQCYTTGGRGGVDFLELLPLSKVQKKPHGWWRFFNDMLFMWNIEKICQESSEFIKDINSFHRIIKFLADLVKQLIS